MIVNDKLERITGNLHLPAEGDKPARVVSRATLRALERAGARKALADLGVAIVEDAPVPEGKMRAGAPTLVRRQDGTVERVWPLADVPEPEPEPGLGERIAALEAKVADQAAEIGVLKAARS